MTFDGPVTAFGFDTNYLMGQTFDIAIFFLGGGSFTDTVTVLPNSQTLSFYGFVSSARDIQSIQLNGDYSTDFGFALDNFTFTDTGEPGSVPEPSTIVLMAAGVLGIGAFGRKRGGRGEQTRRVFGHLDDERRSFQEISAVFFPRPVPPSRSPAMSAPAETL